MLIPSSLEVVAPAQPLEVFQGKVTFIGTVEDIDPNRSPRDGGVLVRRVLDEALDWCFDKKLLSGRAAFVSSSQMRISFGGL